MAILISILLFVSSVCPVPAQNVRCDCAVLYEYDDEEAVFETSDGHLWGVYGTFEASTDYVLIFDTLGTDDVTDDIVMGVIQCVK